jgi:hypothetical protein
MADSPLAARCTSMKAIQGHSDDPLTAAMATAGFANAKRFGAAIGGRGRGLIRCLPCAADVRDAVLSRHVCSPCSPFWHCQRTVPRRYVGRMSENDDQRITASLVKIMAMICVRNSRLALAGRRVIRHPRMGGLV